MSRPAGAFSAWLAAMRRSLEHGSGTDVPCGDCTACCRASQFVHIAPDELDTLAHVPRALLFPAPGAPRGHVLMGYDERGRCPMLGDDGCTIYEHRPRTCRVYDCRVFAAAGTFPDEPGKGDIAVRAREWAFDHPTATDRAEHAAVERAAVWLAADGASLPAEDAPRTTTQRAVLAVELADAFADPSTAPPAASLAAHLASRRRPPR